MGMLLGVVGALSTFYPDAKHIDDPANRYLQRVRLLAKLPTIAAFAFRHSRGLPYEFPRNDLDYIGNFVNMTFSIGGRHQPNKVLQRALEILLILHADHEQNCSTSAVRAVGSSHVDPFSAVSAGIAALYGPLHGGRQRGRAPDAGRDRRQEEHPGLHREGEGRVRRRLMGFGHRVYKSYDPRAKLIKKVAYDVFEQTGLNPKLEIALELERIALEDEYFIKRKLYPNVDFYSGLIYQAMGYPTDYFTVLFAIGRTPGWLAQWEEMLLDKDQKIARPRQIYVGPGGAGLRAAREAGRPAEGGAGDGSVSGKKCEVSSDEVGRCTKAGETVTREALRFACVSVMHTFAEASQDSLLSVDLTSSVTSASPVCLRSCLVKLRTATVSLVFDRHVPFQVRIPLQPRHVIRDEAVGLLPAELLGVG